MTRAGLIGALVIFLVSTGMTAAGFAIAAPCCAVVVGLAAGYLANMWDRPIASNEAVRKGALAGAIGGAGAFVGHILGAVLMIVFNGGVLVETSQQVIEQIGGASGGGEVAIYAGAVGGQCCFGLVAVVLMAGLGALGGIIWWQTTGKNQGGAMAV